MTEELSKLKQLPSEVAHYEHQTRNILYLFSEQGSVMLEVCADGCGQIQAHCEHEKNTWSPDETRLTCNLCGKDGT